MILIFLNLAGLCLLADGLPSRDKRETTDLNPGNWENCKTGGTAPATRVNTTERVSKLRQEMQTAEIQAYYVPSEDEHQSEYPSDYDLRRGYITGFQGSAGYAVITANNAALWTDGRYFLEAEGSLDCNWILMRIGEPGVPTMLEWLKAELSSGQKLGANPLMVGSAAWIKMDEELKKSGIEMSQQIDDLVDKVWTVGRPQRPDSIINALPLKFAGISWKDKVSDMRAQMQKEEVDMLVVTGLDETAWLFNLRGEDIAFNPFFLSYAIVHNETTVLYLLNHTRKLTENYTDSETNVTLAQHLNTNVDGTCTGRQGECVQVKEYNSSAVVNDVRNDAQQAAIKKVWLGYTCNYAIYSAVNESKIHQDNTPVATTKTKKNPVEVQGMKDAHIRDAAALIEFLTKLEKGVKAGEHWTELSASRELEKHRRAKQYNRGLSFTSISSSGPNGAIIHYGPSELTDANITTSEMYLLDSGGQYLDGTTDVTRTFHFGKPSSYEKECYTRVLMGHINLFLAKWPKGLYGREIDAIARGPLWDVGLVYRHGTGHGIGMFLSVHEGPGRISLSHSDFKFDNILDENQFFSDEPGYYEDKRFGIRLENIVMVKNATTKYTFPGTHFLTFDYVTLVPYEPNLIQYDMLSGAQIAYLNDYHQKIRDEVGPLLMTEAKNWMLVRTAPYTRPEPTSAADSCLTSAHQCWLAFLLVCAVLSSCGLQ